jgi:hypothetical protein
MASHMSMNLADEAVLTNGLPNHAAKVFRFGARDARRRGNGVTTGIGNTRD